MKQRKKWIENTDNVITGGWNDSIPQAGWAVMDGPISDFTASGKTGNMLPKNNELSGRSGEGRAGKSAGEMVEKEFVGKDGRTIPPRLSDERLQKGVVQEKRHKPNMGSTGGGKLGGWGAEGLTDNVPPQLQMELKKLVTKEAQIMARSSKLLDSANPYLSSTSELRQAAKLVEEMQK